MHSWTPLSGLAGGLLIGLSASLLLLFNGRIAGCSGILGGGLFGQDGQRTWRLLFLLGVVAGSAVYYALGGIAPVDRPHFPPLLLAVAGLLVGYGTGLGNGCTSGHGVCGLGLLSVRSLVATLTFLTVGILTAVVVRHVFGVF